MLDKRDIQTLMYCIRVAETAGVWQPGSPVRTPNDLECKLAELLHEIEAPRHSRHPRRRLTPASRCATLAPPCARSSRSRFRSL